MSLGCNVTITPAMGPPRECINDATHYVVIRTGRKNSGSRRFYLCAMHLVLHKNARRIEACRGRGHA